MTILLNKIGGAFSTPERRTGTGIKLVLLQTPSKGGLRQFRSSERGDDRG